MILLIVLILVAAAITGSLGGVLEVAAGVAVGLFLFVVGVALLGYWFARHKWRRVSREYRDRSDRGGYPVPRYRDD
jgi:Kef-type K+ transport system membrane component KefB